jgi:hypothetical protein
VLTGVRHPHVLGYATHVLGYSLSSFLIAGAYAPTGIRFLCLCSVRRWVKSLFCAIAFSCHYFLLFSPVCTDLGSVPARARALADFRSPLHRCIPRSVQSDFSLRQFGPPVSRSLVAAGLGAGKEIHQGAVSS